MLLHYYYPIINYKESLTLDLYLINNWHIILTPDRVVKNNINIIQKNQTQGIVYQMKLEEFI